MDKTIVTANVTAERIKKYLEQGKRFDGRKPEEFRDIIIEKHISKKAEGSVRVKIGKTEILVGVKMGVMEPYPDSPNKGNLMVTAELLPLSSPRFETGPPKFPAIELGRVTDRIIRESKVIDLEKLVIKEGEKVWNVFVDIYTINDDGNLFDAAAIGAMAALTEAKMPKYDEKEGKIIYGELTDKKLPLKKDLPITITVHKIGHTLVVDTTREEEDISEARVSIGIENGVIHSMQKGETGIFTEEEFGEVLDLAEKTASKIYKKVEKYLN
ncbi:exosome complex protein Rrp42 [Candidatus Pacearchaeota archaeon]|nr:exosome complex protein Rrp42 [Candidatus Pacearchaeota archaeon]